MIRKIVSIDEQKCNGCGICITACHEGALQLVDGKAKLVSESYCDGLGDCLPNCPTGAITIEEREAEGFDEQAVKKNIEKAKKAPLPCGCPSAHSQTFSRKPQSFEPVDIRQSAELMQWPCQIRLVPSNAAFFNGAKLLIAADCTAFAYAQIHNRFMRGKITLIGCPKLDDADYAQKLAEIIKNNNIKSVEILRMSVPCCSGLENAVKKALIESGKMIPWGVTVINTDGTIRDE